MRLLAQLLKSRHRLWQANGSGLCAQNYMFCGSSQLFCQFTPTQPPGPDISALDPHLQQQWHPTANEHLGSVVVKKFSRLNAWWACNECPDGHLHEWLASVSNRSQGRGCPQCSGHKLCKHSSLATKFPEVAPYWDVARNERTADNTQAQSNKMAHWKCPVCSHAWMQTPYRRVQAATACPKCKIGYARQPNTPRPTFEACQHHLLLEWNFDQNAAAGLFPSEVTLGSVKPLHWNCNKCPLGQQHSWVDRPQDRTGRHRSGCPFCAGRAVCKCNSLQTKCPVAAEWHPTTNAGSPDDYTYSAHHEAWWQDEQKHTWQQAINSRVASYNVAVASGRKARN